MLKAYDQPGTGKPAAIQGDARPGTIVQSAGPSPAGGCDAGPAFARVLARLAVLERLLQRVTVEGWADDGRL